MDSSRVLRGAGCGAIIVLLAVAVLAADGDGAWSWRWISPRPAGHTLQAVASDGALVVAAGRGPNLLVSGDGARWRLRSSEAGAELTSVAWGGGRWVAVGGLPSALGGPTFGAVVTSPDGETWTNLPGIQLPRLETVVWDGSRFLAAGRGVVLESATGELWTVHQLDSGWEIRDLAFDGGLYVAVGTTGDFHGGTLEPAFFTSGDCRTWSLGDFGSDLGDPHPEAIAWSGGRFVAAGWGAILVSDDGLSWSPTFTPEGRIHALVETAGGFVAFGSGGRSWFSRDGVEWEPSSVPGRGEVQAATWLQGRILAVGDNGLLAESFDGISWWRIDRRLVDFSSVAALARGRDRWVAVGIDRSLVTADGLSWQSSRLAEAQHLTGVVFDGRLFWAVDYHYGVFSSPDGMTWTHRFQPAGGVQLTAVAAGTGRLVAVGSASPQPGVSRSVVLVSEGGNVWRERETGRIQWGIKAVAWTGVEFVAVGIDGLILRSATGDSWEQLHVDPELNLWSVAGDSGRWVAVGERWQRPAAAVVGASGTTPQLIELPTAEVPWGLWIGRTAARWVITLSPHDLLLTSDDGYSWERVPTGLGIDPHVAFGSATELLVLGRSGAVVRGTLQSQPRAPTGRRLEAPDVPDE